MRRLLGIVAGVIVAVLLMTGLEWILGNLYPSPTGTNLNDPEEARKVMEAMPAAAKILLLVVYAIASFAGGLVTTLIAGRSRMFSAMITGVLLTVAGIINVISIPHPIWLAVCSILIYIPFAYLGYLAGKAEVSDER